MGHLAIGELVSYRRRTWIVVQHDGPILRLRPILGDESDGTAVLKPLSDLLAYEVPEERLEPGEFPLPDPNHIQDALAVWLVGTAAQILLRDGVAPFLALSRIAVEPRPYQLAPLLLALQQKPIRLFIADDVGVGKTIEALLIARELWDRGLLRRFAVLAPPHLCDQWAREMASKFAFQPTVIRTGTLSRLERELPPDPERSLYQRIPVQVISIDFIKSERNRHLFLQGLPDLLIVDEAHLATLTTEGQQRYDLLKAIVAHKPDIHLILLSATPHSGIERSFQSLMALLHEDFGRLDFSQLSPEAEAKVRRHFIQRTRATIRQYWETQLPFPERRSETVSYQMSEAFLKEVYQPVLDFCRGWVETEGKLTQMQQRMRYWGALAILRGVMSSPAAAVSVLERKSDELEENPDFLLDSQALDPLPDEVQSLPADSTPPLQKALKQARRWEQRPEEDAKLQKLLALVEQLLPEGFSPIIWCRYIRTAEYVHAFLSKRLGERAHFTPKAITGRLGEEERRQFIETLPEGERCILIATDCLAEGINLQHKFDAAIHYDLPWNPNRLEQREGRIDRFGQRKPVVKTFLLLGQGNPLDGVVMQVLLEKAQRIRQDLGVMVPVPDELSPELTQALVEAILFRSSLRQAGQGLLPLMPTAVTRFHQQLERWAQTEKETRVRFSQVGTDQKTLIEALLTASRQILTGAAQQARFFEYGLRRLDAAPQRVPRFPDSYYLPAHEGKHLPDSLKQHLPVRVKRNGEREYLSWYVTFHSPPLAGMEAYQYMGRAHPFLVELAREVLRLGFIGEKNLARVGALRTKAVSRLTYFYLVRLRYRLRFGEGFERFAEEVLPVALESREGTLHPCNDPDALWEAAPAGNISPGEKRELAEMALAAWRQGRVPLDALRRERESYLRRLHQQLHPAEPFVLTTLPPDLLALLILQPAVL